MIPLKDPLATLLAACNGSVTVMINEHRTSHETAAKYLEWLHDKNRIPRVVKEAMATANHMVRIQHDPGHCGVTIDAWGASVTEASVAALEDCMRVLRAEEMEASVHPVNWTELMEELGKTCKHEVQFEYNAYKANTWGYCGTESLNRSVAEYLAFMRDTSPGPFLEDEHGPAEISVELARDIITQGAMFELFYYPSNSDGYYAGYSAVDPGPMLEDAVKTAKAERSLYESTPPVQDDQS